MAENDIRKSEAELIADFADAFVRGRPVKGQVCTCGHIQEDHTRLGKRNIWICKGINWRCLCMEFIARG